MFKVGDWVKTNGGGIFKIVPNYTICSEYETWLIYIERDVGKIELWVPKEGEWCWVDKRLGQIISERRVMFSDGTELMSFVPIVQSCEVEPFLGESPSFLKENR